MKILQLCNKVPFPPKDGGALAIWNLSKGMVQQGIELYILALNTSKHPISDFQVPEKYKEKIQIEAVDIDTRIKYTDLFANFLFGSDPYNLIRFKSEKFSASLNRVLETFKPDIVLLEGLPMVWYIPAIREYSEAKVVMRAHNVEHIIWNGLAEEEKSPLTKLYFKNLTKRIRKFEIDQLKNYDALLPISLIDEKWYRFVGFEKPSETIPFGVESGDFTEIKNVDIPNDLIYIGALDWAPNLDGLKWFVKEVWPTIHSEFPELKLHVAGRNPSDEVRKIVQVDGIIFYGEIDNISDLMNKGMILIVPLFSGSGMRVKIIEGLQAGKLIITTHQGLEGIPAYPGEQLLEANSVHEFTSHIITSLSKPEIIRNIGLKGQEFVKQNFNNFALSKKLINFFNSLVE